MFVRRSDDVAVPYLQLRYTLDGYKKEFSLLEQKVAAVADAVRWNNGADYKALTPQIIDLTSKIAGLAQAITRISGIELQKPEEACKLFKEVKKLEVQLALAARTATLLEELITSEFHGLQCAKPFEAVEASHDGVPSGYSYIYKFWRHVSYRLQGAYSLLRYYQEAGQLGVALEAEVGQKASALLTDLEEKMSALTLQKEDVTRSKAAYNGIHASFCSLQEKAIAMSHDPMLAVVYSYIEGLKFALHQLSDRIKLSARFTEDDGALLFKAVSDLGAHMHQFTALKTMQALDGIFFTGNKWPETFCEETKRKLHDLHAVVDLQLLALTPDEENVRDACLLDQPIDPQVVSSYVVKRMCMALFFPHKKDLVVELELVLLRKPLQEKGDLERAYEAAYKELRPKIYFLPVIRDCILFKKDLDGYLSLCQSVLALDDTVMKEYAITLLDEQAIKHGFTTLSSSSFSSRLLTLMAVQQDDAISELIEDCIYENDLITLAQGVLELLYKNRIRRAIIKPLQARERRLLVDGPIDRYMQLESIKWDEIDLQMARFRLKEKGLFRGFEAFTTQALPVSQFYSDKPVELVGGYVSKLSAKDKEMWDKTLRQAWKDDEEMLGYSLWLQSYILAHAADADVELELMLHFVRTMVPSLNHKMRQDWTVQNAIAGYDEKALRRPQQLKCIIEAYKAPRAEAVQRCVEFIRLYGNNDLAVFLYSHLTAVEPVTSELRLLAACLWAKAPDEQAYFQNMLLQQDSKAFPRALYLENIEQKLIRGRFEVTEQERAIFIEERLKPLLQQEALSCSDLCSVTALYCMLRAGAQDIKELVLQHKGQKVLDHILESYRLLAASCAVICM